MPPPRFVEPADILEERARSLALGFPTVAPDPLSLDGFEERLNHGIAVTIALSAYPLSGSDLLANHERRELEAMLG